MTKKMCLPKQAFTRFVNEKSKIKSCDYSSILMIYLSLYKNGNAFSLLAYNIAKCYLNMFDFPPAEEWIKKAIALEPLDKYYLFLAQVYEFKYDYDNAVKLYLKVLQDHPNDEWALHNIVLFYQRPGGDSYVDKQFVRECLIKLINRNKDDNLPFYCFELARIEYSNGEYSVAEELLNKAVLSLEPIAPILLKDINELMEKIWNKK